MSQLTPDQQESFIEELRTATAGATPADNDFVDMVVTGFEIAMFDGEVATLIEDSATKELTGVRSTILGARMLRFQYESTVFNIEIRDELPQIVGHIESTSLGVVSLEQPNDQQQVILDQLRAFEFDLDNNRPFRLVFHPSDAPSVASEWIFP